MKNGWTGGQYSLFRAAFGLYLLVHFYQLIPYGPELFSRVGVFPDASVSPLAKIFPNILGTYDSAEAVICLLWAACAACLFFIAGCFDRFAALLLWYVWACLFGRDPLISNPSLPYIGWMLLAHTLIPTPYGSWNARGRVDPGGDWKMPQALYVGAWILLGLGYTYSGYTKLVSPSWVDGSAIEKVLNNPLARPGFLRDAFLSAPPIFFKMSTWGALGMELLFAPLALLPKARPWIWGAMLGMHLSLMGLIDFADLSLGMVMIHSFTFDPGWIKPLGEGKRERIFYDGHCGLCHGTVRFILAEDPGEAFSFSPLQEDKGSKASSKKEGLGMPESLVVRLEDGGILMRSEGVSYILKRMGGLWRVLGTLLGWIPLRIRDLGYDGVARIRYKVFGKTTDACPLIPPHLRNRFKV